MIKRWLWCVPVVVGADGVSKQWAWQRLADEPPIVLSSFLRLIYVENSGSAFGLFDQGGEVARWGLIIFSLLAVAFLFYYWLTATSHRLAGSCCLLIGGALGNIIDRFRLGYVIDFIDFHIVDYHWPAFNVADIAITVGAFLLLVDVCIGSPSEVKS